ncbi:hypothetical protein RRF57_011732 [Xylaria bambusicola]|uniref:Uncharacterized protein n=1 Tax=Xylaria bambusicola TaxID=326684 RepID=A0AAN7Z3Y8_9PEZI
MQQQQSARVFTRGIARVSNSDAGAGAPGIDVDDDVGSLAQGFVTQVVVPACGRAVVLRMKSAGRRITVRREDCMIRA